MLLTGRQLPVALLFFTVAAWPAAAQREEVAPGGAESASRRTTGERAGAGHGSLTTQLGLYHQVDKGDGNPFVDEELTVIEPAIILDYDNTDRLGTTVTLTYDHISSASVDRVPGRSKEWGGSDDYYAGGDLGLRYRATDQLQVGGHLGYSIESDYRSFGFGGNTSWSREDQNATVSLRVDGYADRVDVIRFDGSREGTDSRTSLSASLVWYQVLSPRMHAELGITGTQQTGFLETPFNFVVIEDPALPPNPDLDNRGRGREVTEELPDHRTRGAAFGRVRRWLRAGTAIEIGGRIYADSWAIESIAIEPRLYQRVFSDRLQARLRYRYYLQSASKYFTDHFTREEQFRTQDSDLGDFDSHTMGGKLSWDVTPNHHLSVAGDYVVRSDGLNQNFYTLAWRWDF